jgi:hypothetical protein
VEIHTSPELAVYEFLKTAETKRREGKQVINLFSATNLNYSNCNHCHFQTTFQFRGNLWVFVLKSCANSFHFQTMCKFLSFSYSTAVMSQDNYVLFVLKENRKLRPVVYCGPSTAKVMHSRINTYLHDAVSLEINSRTAFQETFRVL